MHYESFEDVTADLPHFIGVRRRTLRVQGVEAPAPRSYRFSQRRMNPSSPWGMKITMAMKISPSGIR